MRYILGDFRDKMDSFEDTYATGNGKKNDSSFRSAIK